MKVFASSRGIFPKKVLVWKILLKSTAGLKITRLHMSEEKGNTYLVNIDSSLYLISNRCVKQPSTSTHAPTLPFVLSGRQRKRNICFYATRNPDGVARRLTIYYLSRVIENKLLTEINRRGKPSSRFRGRYSSLFY